ncbi:Uncharacterised protein [Vibrio cholerae]|nr:Uncharacterised protein [Vibrio cholerae]
MLRKLKLYQRHRLYALTHGHKAKRRRWMTGCTM